MAGGEMIEGVKEMCVCDTSSSSRQDIRDFLFNFLLRAAEVAALSISLCKQNVLLSPFNQ